jgi:CopG family transcriptional regulator/antitoxin EndoAI
VAQNKRIVVSVPNKLLQEVDRVVQEGNGNRSQFIREAVQMYILHRKRSVLREQLKKGYQAMAGLNLLLAEEGSDEQLLDYYERQLAEAE